MALSVALSGAFWVIAIALFPGDLFVGYEFFPLG